MHDDVTADLNSPDARPHAPNGSLLPGAAVSGEYATLAVPGCTLLSVLGHGGMGVVFLARQERLHRFVAVKMLTAESSGDEKYLRRLEREARTLATLSHPNIVGCHDITSTEQGTFLIMEFVPGQLSVRDLLTRFKHLPEPVVARIAVDTARGLSYAHDKDICHRDVKPDNLLMYRQEETPPHCPEDVFRGPHARVMICDFGIAREKRPADGSDRTILGSPAYMAPEQAFDLDHSDFHADIYALGSTLYHLLTGQRPFAGKTSLDTVRLKRDHDLPNPGKTGVDVSDECTHILKRMGARDPRDRYASFAEMLVDLEHWVTLHDGQPHGSILGRYPPSFWRGLAVGLTGVVGIILLAGTATVMQKLYTPRSVSRSTALGYWDGERLGWRVVAADEETRGPALTGLPGGSVLRLRQELQVGTRIQLRIRLPGDGAASIQFRDSTGVRWRLVWARQGSERRFGVIADGRDIPLVHVADRPLMDWLALDLSARGNQIDITVDGQLRGVAPLGAPLTPFRLELTVSGSHPAQFTDVWITAPD